MGSKAEMGVKDSKSIPKLKNPKITGWNMLREIFSHFAYFATSYLVKSEATSFVETF